MRHLALLRASRNSVAQLCTDLEQTPENRLLVCYMPCYCRTFRIGAPYSIVWRPIPEIFDPRRLHIN